LYQEKSGNPASQIKENLEIVLWTHYRGFESQGWKVLDFIHYNSFVSIFNTYSYVFCVLRKMNGNKNIVKKELFICLDF
jgi:hypothetical protein